MKINVPFRTNEEIWAEVERFRSRKDVGPYLGPPTDVFSIAEIVFKLNPVPFPGLFHKFKYDAALTPDLQDILIDQDAYLDLEKRKLWQEQRLRFSIGHELAHLFMHAKEIQANQFATIGEFKAWAANPGAASSAEYQADEFAGRLLVPKDILIHWYDHHQRVVSAKRADWREHLTIRSHLAKLIAPRFGVTRKVIETRLDREGIWPVE